MKKIGEYTARGIAIEGEIQEIPLFDGRFDTAYRVVGFNVWSSNSTNNTNPDCIGKLSKNDDGVTAGSNFMRADDDNQIAWAVSGYGSDGMNAGTFGESIIDPDNLVVEDLFVYVRSATDDIPINYMVKLEKYEISDWQGALAMARDRAQGDVS